MKYIEFGIGNTWLVRTEFEDDEGNEYEVPGISGSVYPVGYYFRIWIGKRVLILSTNNGVKLTKKNRRTIKLLFGIQSTLKRGN
ncbi:DUF3977 family protein [Vagococcus sp. BWB3-3]|uniref:DUF3977 family protein n=1 Tax=Vagococcus allomyrinae TaxID=2794353 RepID=A0A940PBT2_9ENTE|nr:DUF3977 family protein [Vagococcus allomyrinae]MBP1041875.1 DUF3977 family protein [Vagococcus allomyrinae]